MTPGRRFRSVSPTSGSKRSRSNEAEVSTRPEKITRRSLDHLMVSSPLLESRFTSPVFAPEPFQYASSSRLQQSQTQSPDIRWNRPFTPPDCDYFSYKPIAISNPPSPTSWGSVKAPLLDHNYYPHIMDRILAESSWDVLHAFRSTSKEYRDKVHAIQTRQLIFFLGTSPPNAIRSPLGRIPSVNILQDADCDDDHPAITNIFSATHVVDIIGQPRDHVHSTRAFGVAFRQPNIVLRFHPTHHLNDVEEPVCARKVVLFGTSIRSSWKSLPPPDYAQEKTVINLRGLNSPQDLVAAFRRFPPSTGVREATIVFTHWGIDMGYTVPADDLDDILDPSLLARKRLNVLVDLAAGMVVGGWLFPDMPAVNLTIVDFHQVPAHQFTLENNKTSVNGMEQCPMVYSLIAQITRKVVQLVDKQSQQSATSPERLSLVDAALGNLHVVTLDEYASNLQDQDELEIDTVQLRYSNPPRLS